jgi:hypothetical protein
MFKKSGRIMILLLVLSSGVQAQNNQPGPSPEQKEFQGLDEQVQGLKEEVIRVNREMLLLQEKLLYPSSSQVSIFVSLETSPRFSLDAIALKLDDRQVQKHIYTYRELEALRKRGVQRLYTGNLVTGKHQMAVALRGKTSSNNSWQQSTTFSLDKSVGPKLLEIRVLSSGGGKPSLAIKEWK